MRDYGVSIFLVVPGALDGVSTDRDRRRWRRRRIGRGHGNVICYGLGRVCLGWAELWPLLTVSFSIYVYLSKL